MKKFLLTVLIVLLTLIVLAFLAWNFLPEALGISRYLHFNKNSDGQSYSVMTNEPNCGGREYFGPFETFLRAMKLVLIIPKTYDGLPVTRIADMDGLRFLNAALVIPDSITSIDQSAFYYIDPSHLCMTEKDDIYYVDNWAVDLRKEHADAYSYSTITSASLKRGTKGIAENLFANCDYLENVTLPNSLVYIGDYAFSSCKKLTNITIPDKVTDIGWYAFAFCRNLTSITIPDSVTSISEQAFYGCESLTNIIIDENNDSYILDNGVLFSKDKTHLYAYLIPSTAEAYTIPDSVTSIGNYAFRDCTGLTSIAIPDGVTNIGTSAFSGCGSLTSITIPSSVTSIGDRAFSGCDSLTSITIPNSVTTIGDHAFSFCDDLTSVHVGSGMTGIDRFVFSGCNNLTSITIPDSVTSIGKGTFLYCRKLTSITFKGTKAQWAAISKGEDWNLGTGEYTIYCTDGEIPKE